ncbi:uncharacterized protein LOC110992554 [Pieris rapae]|uniref:uncharacterized protein LOC110992554 n=1 Tax=Pieris rapae TaxID=64459 RepID=UPI001E27C9D4|nr:uncharacterized protein LOC110992554 [Pieris rapae]
MRVILLILCVYLVECKINSKALTESLGQEVIEIGAPVKELPAELEEEPSVENDDEVTSTTIQVATKQDTRKKMDKQGKDIDKIDGIKQEDEEARIEKELAEIYKDSSDYKSESGEEKEKPKIEVTTQNVTTLIGNFTNTLDGDEKAIGRMRTNFKFQPNSNNAREIEMFRTSVDEISCEKNKLSATTTVPDSAVQAALHSALIIAITILAL